MSALLKQIVVSLILAGLFGLVFLLRKPGPDDRSALSPQECLKRFGFYQSLHNANVAPPYCRIE